MPSKNTTKKTSTKGDAKRRRVALLAANDQSPQQIAPQVKLKERRVQQILNEPLTQELVERFRLVVERQRQDAEGSLLTTLVGKLETPDWRDAVDGIERRLAAREKIELAKSMPAGGSVIGSGGGEIRLEEFFAMARGVRVG